MPNNFFNEQINRPCCVSARDSLARRLCFRGLSRRIFAGICILPLLISLFCARTLTVSAGIKEDNIAANQALPIESNLVENWPTGPTVSAEAAILMEANTGTILYAKNIHQKEYPASTTKILTTLIAHESCALDELVSFSYDSVFDIDRGSNHIAIDPGEKLTMEECLNAILIRSANEVSLAVAEHISGGAWEEFAPIMNARAQELGCLNSNFVNPNGLPDENHYTTAYDLAMIGKAFFANETLCKITLSPLLKIAASEYQPDDITEVNQMELISTGDYAYEDLVGCKTGYTNAARSALVSCAERNGMKLICVVLKDEAPYQYEDTIALFEYGFNNFDKINVSQTETKYNIDNTGSFYSGNDIFGSSQPLLALNRDACIIVPKTVAFEDLTSVISYDAPNENQAALITYSYRDVTLGTVSVDLAVTQKDPYPFSSPDDPAGSEQSSGSDTQSNENPSDTVGGSDNNSDADQKGTSFIIINVGKILIGIAIIAVLIFLVLVVRAIMQNFHFARRRPRRRRAASRQNYSLRRTSGDTLYNKRRRSKPTRQQLARRRRNANTFINKYRDYD